MKELLISNDPEVVSKLALNLNNVALFGVFTGLPLTVHYIGTCQTSNGGCSGGPFGEGFLLAGLCFFGFFFLIYMVWGNLFGQISDRDSWLQMAAFELVPALILFTASWVILLQKGFLSMVVLTYSAAIVLAFAALQYVKAWNLVASGRSMHYALAKLSFAFLLFINPLSSLLLGL